MARQKEFDYEEKLKCARDLFWDKGYKSTSMNDLVDALEINRSSLYLAYGSKHELFLKSLDSYIQKKEEEYRKVAKNSKEPMKAVENLVQSVLESILQDDKTCLVVNSTFELARTDKAVKKRLTRQTVSSVKLFQELLETAKENGELKTDKEPGVMAHFIVMSISSIWATHILFGDEKLTTQMTDILLKTITE